MLSKGFLVRVVHPSLNIMLAFSSIRHCPSSPCWLRWHRPQDRCGMAISGHHWTVTWLWSRAPKKTRSRSEKAFMATSGPGMKPSSALVAARRSLLMAAFSRGGMGLLMSFCHITSFVASRHVVNGPLLRIGKTFRRWKSISLWLQGYGAPVSVLKGWRACWNSCSRSSAFPLAFFRRGFGCGSDFSVVWWCSLCLPSCACFGDRKPEFECLCGLLLPCCLDSVDCKSELTPFK